MAHVFPQPEPKKTMTENGREQSKRQQHQGDARACADLRVGQFPRRWVPIIIVGNGIAGMTAAVEARRLAADREILLLTEQNHSAINTPALKQFAMGKLAQEDLLAFPTGTETALGLQAIQARVVAIDAQNHTLTLAGGEQIGYKWLLLAPGSIPNGLPAHLPGQDYDGVCVLHRLRDYLDLRRRLPGVEEVVVVGGGVHAAETALSLAHLRNIRVHWLIRGKKALSHISDQRVSDLVLEQASRLRVAVHPETEVAQIHGHVGSVAGILTTRKETIRCQLVLVCTGSAPATELAECCTPPLELKRGIVVDYRLRTSGPDIYCAGDAAAIWDPQAGGYAPRAQWLAAVSQGRHAAHFMLGSKANPGPSPFGARWHATQIGDLTLLTVGNPLGQQGAESITEDTSNGYRRLSLVADRLVGYLFLGREPPDGVFIKQMIDSGQSASRSGLVPFKRANFTGRLAWTGGST